MNTLSAQERKRQIRERRRQSKVANTASTNASSVNNSSETTTSGQEGKPDNCGTRPNTQRHDDTLGSPFGSGGISIHVGNHDISHESNLNNNSIFGYSNTSESKGHTTKKPRIVTNDLVAKTDTDNSHSSLGIFALGLSQTSASCSKFPSKDGFSLRSESSRKRLFSDDNGSEKAIKKRNSLFSAVMNRASLSPKPFVDLPMKTNNAQLDATISTDYNGDSSRSNLPATYASPKKKIMISKTNSPLRSPGGHSIIEALEAVSDFNRSWYRAENVEVDDVFDGDETNFDEKAKADNRRDSAEDWHIADIEFKNSRLMSTNIDDPKCKQLKFRLCKQNSPWEQTETEYDKPNPPAKHPLTSSGIIEETNMPFEDITAFKTNNRTYQQPIEIGVLDWTLKKRAKLEFFPVRCMPGVLPSCLGRSSSQQESMPDEGLIHQLAVKYLSKGEVTDKDLNSFERLPSIEESATAKWLAATMYYQHPAVHPLPSALFHEERPFSTASKKQSSFSVRNAESNNPHLPQMREKIARPQNQLLPHLRGPRSILQRVRLPGLGSMGGLGSSIRLAATNESSRYAQKSESTSSERADVALTTVSVLLKQRRSEWQEAFRSMYNSWRTNLRCLEAQLSNHDPGINSSPGKISRCSFYSILSDQVILFRGGLATNAENENSFEKKSRKYVEPVIVFSSTTLNFRSKLRKMGVKLRLFPHYGRSNNTDDKDDEFSETSLESGYVIKADGADAEVDAELKSLLQVSTQGVGAEVSVAAKQITKQNGNHHNAVKRNLSPMFVSGDDDCLSVYEILLNTCGNSMSSYTQLSDVPLLVCRSIGPCMHTSLRTLSTSACRDDAFHNQSETQWKNDSRPKSKRDEITAVVELRGPIVPCALRDLICASVNWLLLDKECQNSIEGCKKYRCVDGKSDNLKSFDEDAIGSHHVAMFVQPYVSDCSDMTPNATGSPHSCFFNGSDLTLLPDQSQSTCIGSTTVWHECISQEYLHVIVWDILRTSTLAYKTSFAS